MAYDFDAAYQPPQRPYLSQRPQSPQVFYRQPEQQGFRSLPAAHDELLYNASDSHDQPLVDGPYALDDRNAHPGATHVAPYDRRPGPPENKDSSRRRAASRAGGPRRPLVEAAPPVAMSQDNAFPVFPTKKAVAQQAQQAQQPPRPRDDQSRSRPSTANGRRNAPERPSQPDQPRGHHSRPSTSNGTHPSAARPQGSPHHNHRPSTSDQPDGRAHAQGHAQRDVYQSPPRRPQPPIAQFPTFSPPYSQSSRPSTSESAAASHRPFLAPLDTHVANDPHVVESPQLSTVRARHSPAIVPNPHVSEATHAQAAHMSQSAHLSQVSTFTDFVPPQNARADHQGYDDHYSQQQPARGDRRADQHVYDDHYSRQPPGVDREAAREAEIEAEMPNFDNASRQASVHARQLTIDEHLNNLDLERPAPAPAPQPQPQPSYQTASSKLKSAKSQPDLRQRSPPTRGTPAAGFDFGFGGQPLLGSPEPQHNQLASARPAQGHYHQQHPLAGQQRSASYDVQTPNQAMSPPVPPHSFTYDDYGPASSTNPRAGYGYDEPTPASSGQHDRGFDGQPQAQAQGLMPPQNQQRSYSYDDQRPAPTRPPNQQRAFTYDDQGQYNRPPPQRQYPPHPAANGPLPNGRLPNGPTARGPMLNGPPPNGPMPGGSVPRGPPRRGPMPPGFVPPGPMPPGAMAPGSMPPGAMPSGPMPSGPMPPGPMSNDPSRRGPMPPRPMPPGQMPPGQMPRGPTNQSRRPPPGHTGYAPGYGPAHGPGMRSIDGRAPVQRHAPDNRAPSAPPTQGEFAPPPPLGQPQHGYGPDMNPAAMNSRTPMQRFPPDNRAPTAPPTQNGFAPPPHSDRSFGPPIQRYAPDGRAPTAPQTQGGFGAPSPPEHSFNALSAQQRSAPQTRPGAQQQPRPTNPDALPMHPVPVRPGLTNPPVNQSPKPAPVRHYAGAPDPSPKPQHQARPSSSRASVDIKRDSGPVTLAELDSLRSKVDATPNDSKTALFLAKRLVEAASVLASENGRLDAKSTAKNREKYITEAHKRVKKLVAAGYPDAMFYLADCYGSGDLGLAEDAKQAFSLYQSAAKAGHGPAAYRTAVCCELGAEEGGGTKRDYTKATQWYQRAAQLQDVAAMYKMGIILLRGLLEQQRNVRQAVAYLKRAAEHADANNPHALHELARLHEEGNPDPLIREGVVPDEKYSQKLYTQAAKLGYKNSQFRLGQAFEYGSLGLPVDSRNSIAWYSKAAAQGEHNSELALSGWYLTGAEGILEQSDTEAYLWARKAATSEPPLAKAMYAFAYYTENGMGCPASLEEAKRWYGRAASYKFPKAIERLEEIRKGKTSKPPPNSGRLTRRDQKRDEAECVVM